MDPNNSITIDSFLDDLLDDDVYNDTLEDDFPEESLDDEIEDIKTKKKKVAKDAETKKIPIGIEYPGRNLLIPESRDVILRELKIADLEYVSAPKIFIITLDGFITGIKFNESTHTNSINVSEQIPIIKSNYGKIVHEGHFESKPYKKTNRGRNKKVVPKDKKGRKKVISLKSQITLEVHRPEIERSTEIIIHKLFRLGSIQISGLTYNDIPSSIKMVDIIIEHLRGTDMIEHDLDGEELPVKLTSLCSIMENYKFNIIIGRRESIDLMHLKREIINNSYLLATVNNTGEAVSLLYVSYEYTLAAMKFVLSTPGTCKKKKTLTTTVFSTGKVNILGCCGVKYAYIVAHFLNVVMKKTRDSIIIFNRDCNWSKYLLKPEAKVVDGDWNSWPKFAVIE